MLARALKTVTTARTAVVAQNTRKTRQFSSSSKPRAVPFFTAASLAVDDAQLAASKSYQEARAKFSKAASKDSLAKTQKGLEEKGHKVTVVSDKKGALEALQTLIPGGASINLAGSTTLSEIGFVDYLATSDKWNNLKGKMLAEKDSAKQAELRRQATTSDYAICSVDAVTENGEFAMVDASGTRIVLPYSAGKMIFVVGSQKIVKDVPTAWERVHNYVYETESARVRQVYKGAKGSTLANKFEVATAGPYNQGRFHFVLVEEPVGY